MTELVRGQNTALPTPQIVAEVTGVVPGTVDLMVFQVTEQGQVRADDDLVFFNQPTSREGAVQLTGPATVRLDTARVPSEIHTLRLAVCLDENAPGTLADRAAMGVAMGPLTLPALGLTTERAAVLAEVYRRGDQWKVRNVSAGWDGGLPALVTEHGVSVDDSPAPPPAPEPEPVRLTKLTLTKSAPTISLAKSDSAGGTMRVNLNWTQRSGLFRGSGVDLDLACLYQLKNGDKGVVQALGESYGNLQRPPYISLDGDDRSGRVSGGENLTINLDRLSEFRRILIFAYIYSGSPNWSKADGIVTLYPPDGREISVRLDSPDDKARSCAIALLKNEKGELSVTREVRYIHGSQSDVSKAYRWGMSWTPGRK